MKKCHGCQNEKPLTEFHKNKNMADGHQPRCKACMNEAYTISRNKKKDHYNKVRNTRVRATAARYREWKEHTGCAFCEETFPYCLEPHHLDPNEKDAHPSDLIKTSWKRLTEELLKCILVCRNCHVKIHQGIIVVTEDDLNINKQDLGV